MMQLFAKSDAQLVQQTLAGASEAFGDLVRRHLQVAYAVAYARVIVPSDADDVVQEAFLRAYEGLPTLREPARFGAWLSGIARNCAIRLGERHLREAPLDSESEQEPSAAAHNHELQELYALVRTHVHKLEEPDREIVLLHYFAGRNSREIGAALDMPSAAVRKRLQRARLRLGNQMLSTLALPRPPEQAKHRRVMMGIAGSPIAWRSRESFASQASAGVTGAAFIKAAAIPATVAIAIIVWTAGRPSEPAPTSLGTPSTDVAGVAPILPEQEPGETQEPQAPAPAIVPATAPVSPDVLPIVVQGIVYGPDDAPAPGARVFLTPMLRSPYLHGVRAADTPLETTSAATDDQGFFSAKAMSSPEVEYALLRVSAGTAYGFGRIGGLTAGSYGLTLRLRETGAISGSVKLRDGSPAAHARVRPLRYMDTNAGFLSADSSQVVSAGEDGSFKLEQLYVGSWRLLIEAPGAAAFITEPLVTGAQTVVVLGPALRLHGQLVDGDTLRPVPNIGLTAVRDDAESETHRVVTGPDGLFLFDALADATYSLWTEDPVYLIAPEDMKVEPAKHARPLKLKAHRGGSVSGRVVEADSGTPLAGVRVTAGDLTPMEFSYSGHSSSGETAADGTFRLTRLSKGRKVVSVPAGPKVPFTLAEDASRWPTVDVDFGATVEDVDISVVQAHVISGVVRGPDGKPLPNMRVQAVAEDHPDWYARNGMREARSVPSDGEGRFTLYFPGSAAAVYIQAWQAGLATAPTGPFTTDPTEATSADLTAYPTARLFGTFLNDIGKPVPNAQIQMRRTDGHANPGLERGICFADAKGRFNLINTAAGTYELKYEATVATIELAPGEVIPGYVLASLPRDGKVFAGKVTFEGAPATGAQVSLAPVAGPDGVVTVMPEFAFTDASGDFRITGVPMDAESYDISYSHEIDGIRQNHMINGPWDASIPGLLSIELASGGASIEGVVTRNGKPVRATLFMQLPKIEGVGGGGVRVESNSLGKYRIAGLPEGAFELVVDTTFARDDTTGPPALRDLKLDVNTRAGETTVLDIPLDGGKISATWKGIRAGETGRLTLVQGALEVPELDLPTALEIGEMAVFDREVPEDGTLEIPDIPAGTYTLFFAAYGAAAENDEEAMEELRYTSTTVEVVSGTSPISLSLP